MDSEERDTTTQNPAFKEGNSMFIIFIVIAVLLSCFKYFS